MREPSFTSSSPHAPGRFDARQVWGWLTEPSPAIRGPDDRRQAQLLSALLVVIISLAAALEAITTVLEDAHYSGYRTTIVALSFLAVAYGLSRTRHVRAAALLTVGIGSLAVFISVTTDGDINFLDYLVIPILLGSMFFSLRLLAWLVVADMAGMLVLPYYLPQTPYAGILIGPMSLVVLAGVSFLLASWYRQRLERDRQAQLAEREERYRAVVEQASEGIFLFDILTRRVLEANSAFCDLLGYSTEEIQQLTMDDFMPSDHERSGRKTTRERRLVEEQRYRRKDGRPVEVEITTNRLASHGHKVVCVVVRDITERKRVEEARRESEVKYRTLVEQLPAITYLDVADPTSPTGFVNLYVSPQFERLLGYSAPEYQADLSLWYQFIHPDDRARVTAEDANHFATGRASSQEYRLIARDGRVLWVRDACVQRLDEASQRLLTQGILLDITELKQREGELQALVAVSTALRAAQTRAEMPPIILDQLLDLLKVEGVALVLRDPVTGEAVIELARGVWAHHTGLRLPPGEEITMRVIAAGQPYVNNDVRWPATQPNLINGLHAVAGAPLIANNQTIGALQVGRGQTGRSALYAEITSDELRLLTAIADMAASAIHRATLHEQTRRRAEQLAAVNALGRVLAETLDLPQIYERLYEAAIQLLPDSASLYISLFDPERQRLTCAFAVHEGHRLDVNELPSIPVEPPGVGTHSEPIHTRRPLVVNDLNARLKRAQTRASFGDEGPLTQSGLYVPMLAKGVMTGVVQVQSHALNRYSESDAELLALAANTAAVAIENARLFAETERRLRHVQALHANDRAITASLDLRLTLTVLLEQITAQLGVEAAAVLLFHAPTQTLEYAAGRGFRTPAIQRTRRRLGEGHAGRAALEKRIISLPDIGQIQEPFERAALMTGEFFTAYFAAPLIAKGQVKGVLEIFHRRPLAPDTEWLDFLDAVAGQAAIAIDNATLFKDLQRSNTELALAYDTTLEGWSHALDLRDKETEGHTQRVAEMTLRLASAMGTFSEAQLVHLRRGALLHDIGKMGIPDSILHKPGPLTEEEWVVMRRHPGYAYDMLSPIAFLRPALDIPFCHHEKWDGRGYPRGLKGDEIPLAARLFAVVDVWDALCSNRPYRQNWPEEKVREHIRTLAGTHFDPQVVEAFLRLMNESDG